jgi:predicted esterase
MSSNVHHLKIQKTARVITGGNPNSQLKQVWLVAHGYGFLATYFIKKFGELNPDEHFVIVPEGLHRYYLNGVSGRVGASWMTKEEREIDIEDYCNYLDVIYETFISPLEGNVIINAFGFSQGGATICRWAAHTKYKIDNLIVWGSVIPPDMKWEEYLMKLRHLNWIYVSASDDEFLTPEQQKEQLDILRSKGIEAEVVHYDGIHEVEPDTLNLLTEKCVKNK